MPWISVAFVLVVVAAAVSQALVLPPVVPSASGALPAWAALSWSNVPLAAFAAWRLGRRQQLAGLMRFRPGDPSLGIGLGALLLFAGWLLSVLLLPPSSPLHAWVLRIVLLAGDTSSLPAIGCLVALAVSDELIWRGLVQSELDERFGARRGWLLCAALYAAAYAPTLVTLRDDVAGLNPLLFLLALGSGSCWGFWRARSGRLVPVMLSHAAFAYLATQYLERFL